MMRTRFAVAALFGLVACHDSDPCTEGCGNWKGNECRTACKKACECGLLAPELGTSLEDSTVERARNFVARCHQSADDVQDRVLACFPSIEQEDGRAENPCSDVEDAVTLEWHASDTSCQASLKCLIETLGTDGLRTSHATIVPYDVAPEVYAQMGLTGIACIRSPLGLDPNATCTTPQPCGEALERLECEGTICTPNESTIEDLCDHPPRICEENTRVATPACGDEPEPTWSVFAPTDLCAESSVGEIEVLQRLILQARPGGSANPLRLPLATLNCQDLVSADAFDMTMTPGKSQIELRFRGTSQGAPVCRTARSGNFLAVADMDIFVPVLFESASVGSATSSAAWRCEDDAERCNDDLDNDGFDGSDCASPSCAQFCGEGLSCDDEIDNDGDGFADCSDSECFGAAECATEHKIRGHAVRCD
jgi:hypothetical protein